AVTLQLALQAKRIRTVRRWLAAAAGLSLALLLAKWLSNDLLYLIQIAFTKTHLVRTQASLYMASIWESLPKAQTVTILITATLWLIWRRFETSLTRGRTTSVKQGLTMKLIKFTPRLAIASALLGAAALGASGYTYAQKAQQKQLEILRTHVNQSGRTQLDTNLAAGECNELTDQNYTNQYEIKKSANISPADAKQIIMAACQLKEATDYLSKQYPTSLPTGPMDQSSYDQISTG